MNSRKALGQLRVIRELKERRVVFHVAEVNKRLVDTKNRIFRARNELEKSEVLIENYARQKFMELAKTNSKDIGFFSISVGLLERRRTLIGLKMRLNRDVKLLNEISERKEILSKDLRKIAQTNEEIFNFIDETELFLTNRSEAIKEEESIDAIIGSSYGK